MKAIEAMKIILFKGRDPLNVKDHGSHYSWNPDKDIGWIEYRNARNKFPRLSKLLDKIAIKT